MRISIRPDHKAILASAAVIVALLLTLYFMGTLLLTVGLSAIVAYILLPVVRLLERVMPWREKHPDLSRNLAIVVVFLVVLGVVAGALLIIIPPMIEEAIRFIEGFPELFTNARATLEVWTEAYSNRIPENIRQKIESALSGSGDLLFQAGWKAIANTVAAVSSSFALIIGMAVAPILVYYLMKDSEAIRSFLCYPFPPAMRPHLTSALDISNRTIGAYLRGQLVLGLVVGVLVGGGLLLMGVPFPIFLGIVAAVTELIPIIGPFIGAAVGILVTLATEPDKVLWVLLLYLGIQLLENAFLVPRIQGTSLAIHPVVIILVVIIASQYFGLWGIILGPPLVAMFRDLLVYFVRQWKLEAVCALDPDTPKPDTQVPDTEQADP